MADAKSVKLEGKFDGLLAFAAPDTYASPDALAAIFPFLKDGARVVAFGVQEYFLGGMFLAWGRKAPAGRTNGPLEAE